MSSESGGWLILVLAGLTEVVWAVSMGMSDGFSRIGYTVLTAVFLALSTWLLSKALDHGLPVGAAYACWVGIGAVGTVAVSSLIGLESLSPESLLFVAMVAVGVVGLQATGKGHAGSRGGSRRLNPLRSRRPPSADPITHLNRYSGVFKREFRRMRKRGYGMEHLRMQSPNH